MGRGRRILAVIESGVELVLDLVFPPECTACGKEGAWVCSSCARSLARHNNIGCPSCGRAFWRGFFCRRCADDSYLHQCIATFSYADPRVARMVQALKYRFITKSASALAAFMPQTWSDYGCSSRGVCIPIPLHPFRYNGRGFNQAELLAREFCRMTGLPCLNDVLIRNRPTPPQADLSRIDRQVNIRDAFSCIKPESISGVDVVLIDDVYTTGATLQEAARVLKECGAGTIRALTFAHG